jgi:hypothetical protein
MEAWRLNMKFYIKKLSMVLAMLLSVAIVPGAWSATLGETYEITGTVYECEPASSGMQIDTGGEIISVFGKGPVSYWEDEGVAFPEVGEEITILVGEITYSDGSIKLVAISVDVNNDETYDIDLRDENGVPLWKGSKAAFTQSKGNR